jgi:hypothetical protein
MSRQSTPIDIISTRQPQSPSSESSFSSSELGSGLYIPVHKRSLSSSSRSSSPAHSAWREGQEFASEHATQRGARPKAEDQLEQTAHPFVYTPDELINLSRSPQAKLSPEWRITLQATVPEILSNRRQRKAAAHLQLIGEVNWQSLPNNDNGVLVRDGIPSVSIIRSRPIGRITNRRQLPSKIMDEANWRRQRVGAEVMAMANPVQL